LEGRHIRVDRAAQRSSSIKGGGTNVLYDAGRSIFVGNLPFDIQASPHRGFNPIRPPRAYRFYIPIGQEACV
jgi:hypothetical protein